MCVCARVRAGNKYEKLGIRASSTCEVNLNNVFVPSSRVLGAVGEGYKYAIESLNEGRIGIAAQMVGLAQGALDVAMPYVHERKQFGQPIADFQAVRFTYADVRPPRPAHPSPDQTRPAELLLAAGAAVVCCGVVLLPSS